jgi:hypothetical protein
MKTTKKHENPTKKLKEKTFLGIAPQGFANFRS